MFMLTVFLLLIVFFSSVFGFFLTYLHRSLRNMRTRLCDYNIGFSTDVTKPPQVLCFKVYNIALVFFNIKITRVIRQSSLPNYLKTDDTTLLLHTPYSTA